MLRTNKEAMKQTLASKYKTDEETFRPIREMVIIAIEILNTRTNTLPETEFLHRAKNLVTGKVTKLPKRSQDVVKKSSVIDLIKDIYDEYKRVHKDPIEIHVEEEQQEKDEENDNRVPADNVNLCFVGGVSTGKSTILNAIFCEQLTQCKIKRTTMVPTIYIENENANGSGAHTDPDEIFRQIAEKNAELIARSENGEKISRNEYSELVFNVGKLDINILQDAYVNVYDIPGLNDARTKDIYYEYLEHNFHKFNLLIFIVDIHSGLNTSDEIDIVHFITRNTRHQLDKNAKKIYTMVIVNKADDMQLDEDSDETDKLCLTGELSEMYDQVVKTVRSEFERHGVLEQLIGIIPLCAIDSYLYRMVKKHGSSFKLSPEQILKIGVNENGKKFSTLKPATQEKKVYDILNDATFIETMIKLSGFSCLEKTLHKFLNENNTGKTIRVNNLLFQLRKHEDIDKFMAHADHTIFPKGLEELMQKHDLIYQSICKIDPQMYGDFMAAIAEKMLVTVQSKLSWYTYDLIEKLLSDFRQLNDRIFSTYFLRSYVASYYDDAGCDFPVFFKQYVYQLILDFNQEKYCVDVKNLIRDVQQLKEIQFYNPITVTTLLSIFVSKTKMADLESHDDQDEDQDEDGDTENDYDLLLAFCEDLKQIGVDLTHFLRFVIVQDIKNMMFEGGHDDTLFRMKMLYQMYNEIPIQNYLSLQMHKLSVSDNVVMKGLSEEQILVSETLKLDVYYLRYMQLLK